MQRILLKTLMWSVLERWGRAYDAFQTQYNAETLSHRAVRRDAANRLATIATLWTREPALKDMLLTDAPSEAGTIHGFLEQAVYGPYKMIAPLSGWLSQTPAMSASAPVPPELTLLWNDAIDTETAMAMGYRCLSPVKEAEQLGWPSAFEGLPLLSDHTIVEPISVLDWDAPLNWMGTLKGTASRWAERELEKASLTVLPGGQSFTAKFRNASPAEAKDVSRVLAECWLLARLGPAYYVQSLVHGILAKDSFWLSHIEPALFYGLGYFSLLEPSVLLLHETVDRLRSELAHLLTSGPAALQALSSDDHNALWQHMESSVPESDRFTNRHLERAQSLIPALSDNRLIAARPLYPMDSVRERLEGLYAADGTTIPEERRNDVYTVLNQTTELPCQPREIIATGWFTTLQQLDELLANVFTPVGEDIPAVAPLQQFAQRRQHQDYLLFKSLETTSVHQVLLTRA